MTDNASAFTDLADGDTVRYQRAPGGHWRYLTFHGWNSDGSMHCNDDKTGGFRAFMPDRYRFEVKRSGPRKKTLWVPLTTQQGDS